MESVPDRHAREAAETTFDRNVVVVAGAGTGKTTLLVNRMVHLLIKEPQPVAVTQIVALTFTNKAATEMKVRLRERLTALTQPEGDSSRPLDGGAVSVGELRTRYGLSADEIASRATAALLELEKAQIGTLHSFAAHLLRLHPLESRVDPGFQEDDGLRFEEHFAAAWDLWIDHELSREGSRHPLWRSLLTSVTLDEVRSLAVRLSSELIDLEAMHLQVEAGQGSLPFQQWVHQSRAQAETLLQTHDRSKKRKIEQMLTAAVSAMQLVAEQGASAIERLAPAEREWLGKDLGSLVDGWTQEDFHEASNLIGIAQQFLTVDHPYFNDMLRLLIPLVRDIRTSFVHKGWLSFDGLLARARTLLRDHPRVRARIKQDYRAVLVDEFQDTDPVQYEIILAVSERQGRHATKWQEIALDPGKLFIVGDPKQSIYAFRRADIEAFDRVLQKIESDGGMVQTLTTNFRSDASVLGPVNDIFDRLFVRRPLVQPSNARLDASPSRHPATIDPGVRIHITTPKDEDEPFDAAGATRAEGDVLARWINEEVLSRPRVRAGHVAMLFRKLTQADSYLDALRRYRIPYVIEGEKHFYRRQEVIDLISLLRALDHPHDQVALTGLLRSPLGGLTDHALYELRQAGLFDYLRGERVKSWPHPSASAVRRLYGQLARLHPEVAALPLAEAMQLIFDRLPVLDVAAASRHGEQAVANLLKIKQTAAVLSDRPHMTLSGFVDVLVARLDEQPDEAESPLAEESADAVHILTIHKAKGLEFPIVILPGLHQGSGRERALPSVVYDWSSDTYGLTLGKRRTFGAVLVQDKLVLREEAERRRVLYVGMTRAKELLVLSGGVTARSAGENALGLLAGIGEGEIGAAATVAFMVGTSSIPHRVVAAPDRLWPRQAFAAGETVPSTDVQAVAATWAERERRWTTARATPLFVTPTALVKLAPPTMPVPARKRQDHEIARLVGVLAHRILEQWDFTADPAGLQEQVRPAVETYLEPEQQHLAPTVCESLYELCTAFRQSDAYGRLRSASILGREIPFVLPWGTDRVMEGVIDVIYRLDERICIADYKTDMVTKDETPLRAKRYRSQLLCYKTAVLRSLNIQTVACEVIFLRPGVTIQLEGG